LAAVACAIDCSFSSSYPRQYVAYRTAAGDGDLVADGTLGSAAWRAVGFSEPFVDISTATTPRLETRVKLRWDDTFLYVGAYLQEPQVWANISWTCHCVSAADQVIFHDNDFEVFVDADGSTHGYKETEVNAANGNGTSATWDLLLSRPYDDGGGENSSRVYGPSGWDMQPPLHVRTATDGALNVPGSGATHWSVELALPLAQLAYNTTARAQPRAGDQWRINFSRVEWAVRVVGGRYQKAPSCQSCPTPGADAEDNWVWSPQGSIAMHLPERWGVLQFAEGPVNGTAAVRNGEWTVRSVAMEVYYAQHAFSAAHNGSYAAAAAQLAPYVSDPAILAGACSAVPDIALAGGGAAGFTATIASLDGTQRATVRDDRYLRVFHI
jgi:hypothetical protein